MKQIAAEWVDLYQNAPPLVDNITVAVEQFTIGYDVTEEEHTKWEVKRLQSNRYRGPSGMRVEHLK